jgi:hypothetical protein
VVLRRSIRMVVPRSFDRTASRGAGCFPLSELPRPQLSSTVVRCSQALPVDPALFLSDGKIDASIDLVAAWPDGTAVPIFRSCLQRPNTQT